MALHLGSCLPAPECLTNVCEAECLGRGPQWSQEGLSLPAGHVHNIVTGVTKSWCCHLSLLTASVKSREQPRPQGPVVSVAPGKEIVSCLRDIEMTLTSQVTISTYPQLLPGRRSSEIIALLYTKISCVTTVSVTLLLWMVRRPQKKMVIDKKCQVQIPSDHSGFTALRDGPPWLLMENVFDGGFAVAARHTSYFSAWEFFLWVVPVKASEDLIAPFHLSTTHWWPGLQRKEQLPSPRLPVGADG